MAAPERVIAPELTKGYGEMVLEDYLRAIPEEKVKKPKAGGGGKGSWTTDNVVMLGGLATGDALGDWVFQRGIGYGIEKTTEGAKEGIKAWLHENAKLIGAILQGATGVILLQVTPSVAEAPGAGTLFGRSTLLALVNGAIRALRHKGEEAAGAAPVL